MGTETIQQLAGAGGVGHQQQHLHQQRQHNQVNAQPQPFLADGGAAFAGDSVKVPGEAATHPHLNVFGLNHPHIHPPAGAGTKLPAVVGIYRPPAARRALKLAEKALHQLAPPAACENPSDYNHRDSLGSTEHVRRHTEVTTIDKASSTPDNTESGGLKTSPTSEDDGSKCPTQASSPVTDGALGSVSASVECSSVNSSVVSPTSARTNRPHRERRPDRAVYIPRARRSLTTPPVTTSSLLPATTTATTGPNETVSKAADGLTTISNSDTPLPKGTSRVVAANRTQQLTADAIGPSGVPSCSVVVPPEGTGRLKVKQKPHNSTAGPALENSLAKGQLHNNTPILLNCDIAAEESSKRRAAHLGDHRAPVEAFKKRSYSLEEHNSSVQTITASSLDERLQIVTEVSRGNELKTRQQQSPGEECTKAGSEIEQPEDPANVHSRSNETNNETTMHRNNNRNRNAKNVLNGAGMIINNRPTEGDKIDHDEKELRRASQEMNRSNRRIMKQTFNSDVLEIDEPSAPPPSAQVGLGKKVIDKKMVVMSQNGGGDTNFGVGVGKPPGIIATSNGSGGSPTGKASEGEEAGDDEDEEEEDWESMYDDNGDCLNPKMLEELTTAVGKVSIEVPQTDYKSYQTKQAVLNDEEFPHVLEVSNFPAEFKTQDLMMLFSQYKESGFDIKWVDDTHALAVFSSSKIAAEVLATGHSFARVKPLAEATSESRSKARKCASSLQPYRARPETCAALARRLVTTALGVRLKTAPEERENERRVLREAKERKLLAAKQRDEVWDS
ncbi:uncharacterized protein LOC131272156 [Anopheles coustani]|uniref:uncharacterized protein LOC131272156 n=1 Tax=Anopheles coustani TaxID=139045 RepID=UPI00265A3E76|nr:uncharacterized protein LOC131272156 [Anopheles coustani]